MGHFGNTPFVASEIGGVVELNDHGIEVWYVGGKALIAGDQACVIEYVDG